MAINMYLSIITLNINGLNAPIKRHGAAEWVKKIRPTYMLSVRDSPQNKRYTQIKSKGVEKDISGKWKGKKAGVAIFISNKIDFQTKAIIRDKEGHCIMIKGAIQQEAITLVNIYEPSMGAPKCIKQILLDIKGESNSTQS